MPLTNGDLLNWLQTGRAAAIRQYLGTLDANKVAQADAALQNPPPNVGQRTLNGFYDEMKQRMQDKGVNGLETLVGRLGLVVFVAKLMYLENYGEPEAKDNAAIIANLFLMTEAAERHPAVEHALRSAGLTGELTPSAVYEHGSKYATPAPGSPEEAAIDRFAESAVAGELDAFFKNLLDRSIDVVWYHQAEMAASADSSQEQFLNVSTECAGSVYEGVHSHLPGGTITPDQLNKLVAEQGEVVDHVRNVLESIRNNHAETLELSDAQASDAVEAIWLAQTQQDEFDRDGLAVDLLDKIPALDGHMLGDILDHAERGEIVPKEYQTAARKVEHGE